ncbi:hypothetical protein [Microbacterium hominis]|uniref:Type II toxin-antitoxin system PemK/MazF family toxin n=1 Tax=Microbacterium hominis TaxID=162426 RepID=A0A7D4PU18_9MICO|nr:hypothetical protein [Microbacterium hominis]QKJ18954.1 hypothetical protein HQM25_05875 [Microbacterium hominis]
MSNEGSAHDYLHCYDDGTFHAGDIAIAGVRNPLENSDTKGKNRPFVLVRRANGHWRGMGLTTNSHYASGEPRVAVPNPTAVGLRGRGFLWGDRLTSVCVLDIGQIIGRVDLPLATAVVTLAGLGCEDGATLRRAAAGL